MADKFRRVDPPKDPHAHLLSEDDLAEIRAEAQKQVDAEALKLARKAALDDALKSARVMAGLEKADTQHELIEFRLDLPENITPVPALVVDGFAYWDQTTYIRPLPVVQSLLAMEARAWENEARFNGKWRDPRRPRETRFNMGTGGVANAPVSIGLGG